METHVHTLDFQGYWRHINVDYVPGGQGIYCVYACRYNPESDSVSISELIYIGEAANVRNRIQNHERKSDWEKELRNGEELCFTYANVKQSRKLLEKILIYKYPDGPKLNSDNSKYPEIGNYVEMLSKRDNVKILIDIDGRKKFLPSEISMEL